MLPWTKRYCGPALHLLLAGSHRLPTAGPHGTAGGGEDLLLRRAGVRELERECDELGPASGERELLPWQPALGQTHPVLPALPGAAANTRRGKVSPCPWADTEG